MRISNSKHDSMYEQIAAKVVNPISRQICSKKMVQEQFQYEICTETARLWLRSLGFSQKYHKKGVYFDRHERQDVVDYREQFVQQLHQLDRRCIYDRHEPELLEGEKTTHPDSPRWKHLYKRWSKSLLGRWPCDLWGKVSPCTSTVLVWQCANSLQE